MKLLVNHLGYGCKAYKKAVFQGEEVMQAGTFRVLEADTGLIVHHGTAAERGPVAQWGLGVFWTLGFSSFQQEGTFVLELETDKGVIRSAAFEITPFLLPMRLISGVTYWFKGQRVSGEWLARDKDIPFTAPREGTGDRHGGWYDATGDYGVHLSHLSHSTWHNPQQAAFSALVFFRMAELLEQGGNEQYSMVKRRVLDEGFWGADFLMRMRAPSGSFFRSISRGDAFGRVAEHREVDFEYHGSSDQFGEAATASAESVRDENYEVSFRSGGGMAIAALAAASRCQYPGTDHSANQYLQAALDAYAHLEQHNARYTNDGQWHLLDEVCALEALTELYAASREYDLLRKLRIMADRVLARMVREPDGTARFEAEAGLPFHHAADAGLPVVALLGARHMDPDPQRKALLLDACTQAMRFELSITGEVVNPFGYARFLYRDTVDGTEKRKFFFPHNSTAAPWWQGENARLGSLATATGLLAAETADGMLREDLKRYATDQLNWIMGLNPFDSCMIEGYGRNNIQYFFNDRYDFLNAPGGICNGITSGLDNDEGIAFIQQPDERIRDNWRWAEQWIPHATWFLYAQAVEVGDRLV